MKRLIWKEWREKRLWSLIFFALIAVDILVLQDGFCYGGKSSAVSPAVFILILPALLLGLKTFSSETGNECQDFLLSRPIGWMRILTAKLLVDGAVTLIAIVAGAVLYRILLPPDYAPFAGFGQVMVGIGLACAICAAGYLPGFGASVILPGLLGGSLVLCLVIIAAGVEAALILPAMPDALIGLVLAWLLGSIIASIMISRRGLSLSSVERAKKYGIYLAVASTVMLILTVPATTRFSSSVYKHQSELQEYDETDSNSLDISPDGRLLLVDRGNAGLFLVRRSDGVSARLKTEKIHPAFSWAYGWSSPDSLIIFPGAATGRNPYLEKMRMDASGRIVSEKSALTIPAHSRTTLSPSGRYAAIAEYLSNPSDELSDRVYAYNHVNFTLMDIKTMKVIFSRDLPNYRGCRWHGDAALDILVVTGEGKSQVVETNTLHIGTDGKTSFEEGR